MAEPQRISAQEVAHRLERNEPIVFVDARNPTAWAEARTMIPGAIRVPEDELAKRLAAIPRDQTIVTYCT